MAIQKRKMNVLVWTMLVLGAAGATWYLIYKFRENRKAEEGFELDSDNSPVSTCNDNFPLKKGSCGNRVTNVQIMLNVATTGKFNKETQDALYAKSGEKQVTEDMYNYYLNWLASLGIKTV